jgi:hypothetical protein
MAQDLGAEEARDGLLRVFRRNGVPNDVRASVGKTWCFTSKLYPGKSSPDRTFRPPNHKTGRF